MGWPKRALVQEAFAELSIAGWEFDVTPDEMQWACRRLDMLMASWGSLGIDLGYAQVTQPNDTDPDQDSGLALQDNQAVMLALAVNLCAGKGKNPPPTMLKTAREAYTGMLSKVALRQVRPQQLPTMPSGAGNNRRDQQRPFTDVPNRDPLGIAPGGNLDFIG